MPPKKKKKKNEKKRKKKKKHKKKSGRYSDSSGSDSETVYPSDLKREEEADGYGHTRSHHTGSRSPFYTQQCWLTSALYLWWVCVGLCVHSCRPRAAPLASCFSWLDDLQSPTEQPFCVDRKADAANWTYKSLYRGDVAR